MASHIFGSAPIWLWIAFHLLILTLLAFDAWINRARHVDSQPGKNTAAWLTGMWILSAVVFAVVIAHALRPQFAAEYLAGYGIEESLSIDNMFVFLLIFRSFRLDAIQQRKVLLWGVVGAIIMRAITIAAGLSLLRFFSWANILFGVVLLVAAVRLIRKQTKKREGRSRWISLAAQFIPLSDSTDPESRDRFFTRQQGRIRFTHLFLALVVIEVTDLFFASDSIPAVLAVSHHPFVVYTSNIFAVVGLRSLYFVLAAMLDRLHRLQYGLAAILAFMGAKMLLSRVFTISISVSLGVLVGIIAVTVVLSLFPRRVSN